jgi:hypothetical protein
MSAQERISDRGLRLDTFLHNLFRGGCVGSFTVTTVTPIMNFTNHILNQSPSTVSNSFTLRRAFDGVLSYNASVFPMIGVSLATHSFLQTQAKAYSWDVENPSVKLGFSVIAGMLAGIVGALPEGIAQAQQLTTPKPRSLEILKNVVQYHGVSGLTRGIPATMIRQSIFTAGYMALMPLSIAILNAYSIPPFFSELLSATGTGTLIGILTSPPNRLRFEMQKGFDTLQSPPSYSNVLKQGSLLFKGWQARSLMSASSMLLLHKGKEVYDRVASAEDLSKSE